MMTRSTVFGPPWASPWTWPGCPCVWTAFWKNEIKNVYTQKEEKKTHVQIANSDYKFEVVLFDKFSFDDKSRSIFLGQDIFFWEAALRQVGYI